MALTKVGKEGVTGISNSSNATAITIDSSEKVGIGTTSPPDNLSVVTSGSNAQLSVDRSDGGAGRTVLIHSSTGGQLQTTGSVPLTFGTVDTERMRIDTNGSILIGRTNTNNNNGGHYITSGYAYLERNNDLPLYLNRFGSDGTIAQFRRQNGIVGDIVVSSSTTTYNTSSDYRLKTAVNYDWDATTRLKQLKPARFKWIVDGDDAVPVDGFLAHEAQTVVPEAVTGTHNEVDDDGNPVHQGIDQSKLVPLLVKTIQELEARITALEAK